MTAAVVMAALLVGLAAPGAVPGGSMKPVVEQRRLEYRVSSLTEESESASRRMFHPVAFSVWAREEMEGGKPVAALFRHEVTAEGYKLEYEFRVDPADVNLLGLHKKIFDRDGSVIEESRQTFGHYGLTGVFHVQMFPFIGAAVDYSPGAVSRIKLAFNPEMRPMTLIVTTEEEEKITVPAGTFDTYRLRIEYSQDDLPSFLKMIPSYLVKTFMADYLVWVEKAEPHAMVRFQGKTEGPGAPEKVYELVKVR
jgi:hypothetical protein